MNEAASPQALIAQSERHVHPVILSGGSGTRLWPLSRMHYPKQLLPLLSDRTLLQETALRTRDLPGFTSPFVICHEAHRFLVAEQLQEAGIKPHKIVLEPIGRNTAPAITVAALILNAIDPDAVMLVEPSDHHIADTPAFRHALGQAIVAANLGRLTMFGIAPGRPEVGYGYIRKGMAIDGIDGAYSVHEFIEKPDMETAQRLVQSKQHFWNSGIFVLPVGAFLEEIRRLQPEILKHCVRAIEKGRDDLNFFRLNEAAFSAATNISVDKAVMEMTGRGAVLPIEMGWNDIGSWQSLHQAVTPGTDGNTFEGDILAEDVRNSYIRSDGHLVAALGIENLIVVATDDAILVARRERSAEVGKFVEKMRSAGRQETLHHSKVYRPWGYYQTVDLGDRFQVKRLMVKPGAKLSMQMHHHRAEHWVVVQGTARINCNGHSRLLHENQSTYIPLGSTHRLENPGKLPLHLIEVQSGPYLGEDDIVRFEDKYGRR